MACSVGQVVWLRYKGDGSALTIENKLGKTVADRIQITCAQSKYLQEIQIKLPKEPTINSDIAKMLEGAEPFDKFSSGCNSDIFIEKSGK